MDGDEVSIENVFGRLRAEKLYTPTSWRELEWLYRTAYVVGTEYPSRSIIDCGTMNAVSAIVMASGTKEAGGTNEIITIDDYRAAQENQPRHSNMELNCQRIAEWNLDNRIRLVSADDIDFLKGWTGDKAAMVFLDSFHEFKHVGALLLATRQSLMSSGLICGHDYCWHERGLVRAIELWREENRKVLCGFGLEEKIWWTIYRGDVDKEI